jgi:hypothetical protein
VNATFIMLAEDEAYNIDSVRMPYVDDRAMLDAWGAWLLTYPDRRVDGWHGMRRLRRDGTVS